MPAWRLGEPAIFMVIPDLLDHLRAAYNPQSEMRYDDLFEQLRNAPLLVLDDLGTQSSTPWAQEKLFQLLNHRYIARLPTVITTNQRIDELEPRLRSRLHDPDLVKVFAILAPDFRTGKNASQTTLSTLHLHQDKSFENFDSRRNELAGNEYLNLQEVVNLCTHFAAKPQGWIVLAGTYGCGKTHLAAAIANAVSARSENDIEAMFVVVPDLLDHSRSAFSPQSNISYDRLFDAVKNSPILVLDDLGTESATPWRRKSYFNCSTIVIAPCCQRSLPPVQRPVRSNRGCARACLTQHAASSVAWIFRPIAVHAAIANRPRAANKPRGEPNAAFGRTIGEMLYSQVRSQLVFFQIRSQLVSVQIPTSADVYLERIV